MSVTFSLATYNLHKGFSASQVKYVLPQIKHAFQELGVNCLCLQEVVGHHKRLAKRISDWPVAGQAAYLAGESWPEILYANNANYPAGHHGNAIISSYQVTWVDNVILSQFTRMSRGFLHGLLHLPETKQVHILCAHMGLSKRKRHAHIGALAEYVSLSIPSDAPLIIAGDFNDWRREDTKELVIGFELFEAHKKQTGFYAKTFPARRPILCNDRIYFRHLNLEAASCLSQPPWPKLSDHLPLYARFSL